VVPGVAGTWKDLTDSVNTMGANLTAQVRNIADVTTAVARGDLNRKITVDVKGEILELKNTINTMVDQLNSFANEVTRVARDVGTEGKLGGQAVVTGVAIGAATNVAGSLLAMLLASVNCVLGIVTENMQRDSSGSKNMTSPTGLSPEPPAAGTRLCCRGLARRNAIRSHGNSALKRACARQPVIRLFMLRTLISRSVLASRLHT